jgi:hypothetical protein
MSDRRKGARQKKKKRKEKIGRPGTAGQKKRWKLEPDWELVILVLVGTVYIHESSPNPLVRFMLWTSGCERERRKENERQSEACTVWSHGVTWCVTRALCPEYYAHLECDNNKEINEMYRELEYKRANEHGRRERKYLVRRSRVR